MILFPGTTICVIEWLSESLPWSSDQNSLRNSDYMTIICIISFLNLYSGEVIFVHQWFLISGQLCMISWMNLYCGGGIWFHEGIPVSGIQSAWFYKWISTRGQGSVFMKESWFREYNLHDFMTESLPGDRDLISWRNPAFGNTICMIWWMNLCCGAGIWVHEWISIVELIEFMNEPWWWESDQIWRTDTWPAGCGAN
jgi:hypothetical protein